MASAPQMSILGRMMARKSVAQVQRETQTSELKRTLGPWNLLFLGIGCIIGAGIFVRTGSAAALHAGPAVLISYLIAGTICGRTWTMVRGGRGSTRAALRVPVRTGRAVFDARDHGILESSIILCRP